MIGPGWLRRLTSTHPYLVDTGLATLVGAIGVLPLLLGIRPDGIQPTGADAVAAAAAFLLLLARRRAPLAVLAVILLSEIVATAASSDRTPVLEAAAMIAVYTVARTVSRRLAIIVATATAATLFTVTAAAASSLTDPESFAVLAWIGMAAALGGTIRTWRDYLAATEERAVRAEASKEEEARRRVAEERLRIARELHDVIAHHIALINVQAGVAGHVLRTHPDDADTALRHIRDAGRTVLNELGSLLYILRQSGATEPTEPVPDLSCLGQLLDSLIAAGLSIHHRQTGHPQPLPATVGLAAYRIIQEGLTNARKHGTGSAHLLLEYQPDTLHIQIRNPVRHPPVSGAAGTGHGLTGMYERAHAVGGSLDIAAGPTGTFRLDAYLPASVPATQAPTPPDHDPAYQHHTTPGRSL